MLDFREWTFLNADLTVNFSREPVGDWILLDAETWIGPDGAGLAMARLADIAAISAAPSRAWSSKGADRLAGYSRSTGWKRPLSSSAVPQILCEAV